MFEIVPSVTFWTFVNFIVLLWVLRKFAWGPILNGLEKRETHIRESIEKASNARQEAEKRLETYEILINKGRDESREIIDQGQKKAEELRAEIVKNAEQEAKEVLNRADQEINLAREKATDEIKNRAIDLSVSIASKILERDINPEEHRDIIQKAIKNIGASS